jgi:uncharacterized protein YodC (DUF2158 family)
MTHPEKNAWGERLNPLLSVVPKFRVGDVCFLMSGSPALTVDRVLSDSAVEVAWIDASEKKTAVFPSACLRPATWLDRLNAAFGG